MINTYGINITNLQRVRNSKKILLLINWLSGRVSGCHVLGILFDVWPGPPPKITLVAKSVISLSLMKEKKRNRNIQNTQGFRLTGYNSLQDNEKNMQPIKEHVKD